MGPDRYAFVTMSEAQVPVANRYDILFVQNHRQLDEPLRSTVVASARCDDVTLEQGDRGFN